MDVGPCAVSAIQIKPRSVRLMLIINRPAVSGYNVTSVGAKSGHTQDPFAAILFRIGDCAHRRWKVAARTHSIPDLVEVAPQIFVELVKRLAVHAGCTAIGPDCFIASYTRFFASFRYETACLS
jgi:hypothetical protein